jgi:hypothetical protein
MEYHTLILNRTYLVLLTLDFLIGVVGSGVVATEGGKHKITRQLTRLLSVKGDLTNPYSYLKLDLIQQVDEVDLLDGSILKMNKANFMMKRSEIARVTHNPKKKWGMGPHPHDGRICVEMTDGKKREFIMVGSQSGSGIAKLIMRGA